MLLALVCANVSAKKKQRVFYDSKSNLIGISGNFSDLAQNGFTVKFLENEVELPAVDGVGKYDHKAVVKLMNDNNVGKKVLDFLFQYDGKALSEEKMKERAAQNVQSMDEERAEIGVIDKETILREDYLPLLENNFIYLQRQKSPGSRTYYWIVLKVDISKETLDEVYNCWSDMNLYNQIKVSVKYVASGKTKMSQKMRNRFLRDVSRKVPEFAVRGQVVSRNPFLTNIGTDNGIKRKDRVRIYRQAMKDSVMYSKRVSTTRVSKIEKEEANLYTFAGGRASFKKGDVAVLDQDKNFAISFMPWYQSHSFGLDFTGEKRLGLTTHGLSTYFMFQVGAGLYEHFKDRLYAFDGPEAHYAPIIVNGGLGVGVGYHFLHALEIEPYVMAQYEALLFDSEDVGVRSSYANAGEEESLVSDMLITSSVRVPLGLKLNINLWYPVQLTLGAEYDLNIKLDNKEGGSYYRASKYFLDPLGYKRDGLKLYAGFRFNF